MPQRCTSPGSEKPEPAGRPVPDDLRQEARGYDDLALDVAPVLRRQRADEALGLCHLPEPAGFRRVIAEGGVDPARAAVTYLEALVSAALELPIDALDAETAGRVLLAEQVLVLLTGSNDADAVRAWLRAR